MARKIKFPLDMGNNIKVNTLEELQKGFNAEKVVGYYLDGKLRQWLKDRFLDEKADQINSLQLSDDDFFNKIYSILEIDQTETIPVNIHQIRERVVKTAYLKQLTDNEDILSKLDQIAFNQNDLENAISKGYNHIYLCGDNFTLPADKYDMTYEGILNYQNEISISLNTKKELKDHNINLINVAIPERLRKDHELIAYGIKKLITSIEHGFFLKAIDFDSYLRHGDMPGINSKCIGSYGELHNHYRNKDKDIQDILNSRGYIGTIDDVGFYYSESRESYPDLLCTHDKIFYTSLFPDNYGKCTIQISDIKDIRLENGGYYDWYDGWHNRRDSYKWIIVNHDIKYMSSFRGIDNDSIVNMIKVIITINRDPDDLKEEFKKTMRNALLIALSPNFKSDPKCFFNGYKRKYDEYKTEESEVEMPSQDIIYLDTSNETILCFSYSRIGVIRHKQFICKKYTDITDITVYNHSVNIHGLTYYEWNERTISLLVLMGKVYNEIFPDE